MARDGRIRASIANASPAAHETQMTRTAEFAVVLPGAFSLHSEDDDPVLKSGGDLRAAAVLARAPPGSCIPVLYASRPTIAAFRAASERSVDGVSTDGLFDDVSGNIGIIAGFLALRVVTSIFCLNLGKRRKYLVGLYSTSNALPDVLVAAVTKTIHPSWPWVAVVHHLPSNDPRNYAGYVQRMLSVASFSLAFRLIMRSADTIIAYHEPTIEALRKGGVDERRIFPTSNGVNVGDVALWSGRAAVRDRLRVLYVGRFSPQKGVTAMARIWASVSRRRPAATLEVVGADDAMSRAEVAKMFLAAGPPGSSRVVGLISRERLLLALHSARVLAAPSFVEGWGLSVLEAMACGTPVIGWDLPAYRPFRDGMVQVSAGDEEGFSREVVDLLDDDDRWSRLSNRARDVARNFSWDVVANSEWSLMNAIFGRTRQTARDLS